MWKIILIIAFCSISRYGYAQSNPVKEYKLIVNLHNAPFNSLALLDYRDSHNVIIKGKNTSQFKWEFTIPDSIAANSEYMMLIVPDKDTVANGYHQLRFNSEFKNKKTSTACIGIQGKTNYIEATYKGQTSFPNENIADFLGLTDSIVNGNLICDDFNLSVKNDNSDIMIRSLEPYYAWFMDNDDDKISLSYNEHLQSYINLAKRYPDSRYLITYLSLNLRQFKTRQDIKSIYQVFSKKFKNSKWSKKIESFLSDDFKGISYMNLASGRNEPIVQDSSKYNLVIFTASWCGPCIAEIPLLKKLHQDLKARINFTYISLDVEKNTKKFQKILTENKISWRTLYGYKHLDRIMTLFSIKSIPHSFLVYPDGHREVMDVRDEVNQKKLALLE